MTNNTIRDEILGLFDDNANNEISAADMRTYINAIFASKEEIVTKISTATDLAANNTNIYEGSLIIVYNDGVNTGLYLSPVNQPTDITELIKI